MGYRQVVRHSTLTAALLVRFRLAQFATLAILGSPSPTSGKLIKGKSNCRWGLWSDHVKKPTVE